MRRLGVALALVLATALAASGCTGASERRLVVFAAASLNKVFPTIAQQFEAAHPGVTVTFTFDGSSGLVDQLKGGARADVFASADENNMTKAVDARLVSGDPAIFARNVLTLVTPPGNPAGITGLNDSLTGHKLVICAAEVPCGSATAALATKLGVTLKPVSEESKVTDVLGKVTSGEADAGVVYATDAKGAGDAVQTVAIDGADQVVNNYPIAVLSGGAEPGLAGEFVTAVTSQAGREVLTGAGFLQP